MNELIEALKTIKAECKKYPRCCDCPLSTLDGHQTITCAVTKDLPKDWIIVKPKTVIRVMR